VSTRQVQGAFISALVEPHPDIRGGQRRRIRMLAITALVLLLATTPLAVVMLLARRGFSFNTVLLALLPVTVAIAYALSRTQQPEPGGAIFIFGTITINHLLIYTSQSDLELLMAALVYQVIIILISGIVLRSRACIGASAYVLVGIVILWLAFSVLSPDQGLFALVVMGFAAILTISNALLRERDQVALERQSHELERISERLTNEIGSRTSSILLMAEIGKVITASRNLEQLLQRVVDMIVERMDYYHAQVFLLDDAREYAVLRTSTGPAGLKLLARGHKLAVGSRSVIGQVTSIGKAVVAQDTDMDPVHRRNELLPNTRSELALPLQVGGRILGALDVQSIHPNAFDETVITIFQTMADQLAIAIENARLFERAQRDLAEIELLNKRITGEAWHRYAAGRRQLGVQTTPEGLRPIEGESKENTDASGLSLPLQVHGKTIGVLDLIPRDGQPPDEEMRQMLEAVAERVAMALDSTRLSEQSLIAADREQILSRLSASLQATTDLNVILRIAAEEASRALGSTRGFVHLIADYGAEH